ncbi:WD40 repeat-like protein [Phellopilus nigrolimitatus]|nr:WD40 repeat-like protein [Phellopilus nigrolimitatus]
MAQTNKDRPSKKIKVADTPLKSALKKSITSTSAKVGRSKSPARTNVQPHQKSASKKGKAVVRALTPAPKAKSRTDKGKAKFKAEPKPIAYPSTFKVVFGTYEKLLYGLEGSFVDDDGAALEKPRLRPEFIFPAHVSCVKAVAASPDGGKWLATGSTDEIVKVWDLRRRKEIGGLVQHEGSITHLSFPTRSHLISASDDGTICIFRARDWALLRSMQGHKGRVNSVAVHPSGKVGLSVGKDRTLRMWDLMRGKGSASTKLGKEGELVRWSKKGDKFVVQSGATIDLYSTEMSLTHTFTHPSRVHDVHFCSNISSESEDVFLLVAAEDKKVTIYDTSSKDSTSLRVIAEVIGHQNRVKAIDTLAIAIPSSSPRSWTTILSTVSSDGWVRIFDLGPLASLDKAASKGEIQALTAIAEYDTKGSRLTCCALADGEITPAGDVTGKRKLEDEDIGSDEGSEEGEMDEVQAQDGVDNISDEGDEES